MKKSLLLLLILVFTFAFVTIDTKASDISRKPKLEFVYDYLDEMEMTDLSVSNIELIRDFHDNQYYLCSFDPMGYAIFDGNSDEFIEGSFYKQSPYDEYKTSRHKYYLGPLNYYIRNNNKIYDIVNEEYFDFSPDLIQASSDFSNILLSHKNNKQMNDIQLQSENIQPHLIDSNGWTLIDNHEYFRQLTNHPSTEGGCCSFVALSNILGYLDTFYNDNIVSDNYIVKSHSLENSPGTNEALKNKLIDYGHHDIITDPDTIPATANEIESTFLDYRDEFIPLNIHDDFHILCHDNWIFEIEDLSPVYNSINTNRPVMLVMSSYYYSFYNGSTTITRQGEWHTVSAYGYKDDKFIAHCGWEDSSQYIISGAVVISYISISYLGEHVHSRNYIMSTTSTMCGCGHQCNYLYDITNTSQHRKYCRTCSYSIYENHRWVYYDGMTRCRDCGITSNVSPWSLND